MDSPTNEKTTSQEKPKLALLPLKPPTLSKIADSNSPSCSTPKSTVSWVDNPQYIEDSTELNEDTESLNDGSGYDYMLPSPCIFKLFQVIVIIVCTALYSEGMIRVKHSIESQLFPQIICLDYLIITPVILLSYLLGKRMPELLIRIFNMLGAILFLVAGLVALRSHYLYTESYELEIENQESEEGKRLVIRQGVFLLASAILCLINGGLYFADVVWSIHYTLATL